MIISFSKFGAGGGGGGTTDYNQLQNKPKINGVELKNDKNSHSDLGIIDVERISESLYDRLRVKDSNRLYIIEEDYDGCTRIVNLSNEVMTVEKIEHGSEFEGSIMYSFDPDEGESGWSDFSSIQVPAHGVVYLGGNGYVPSNDDNYCSIRANKPHKVEGILESVHAFYDFRGDVGLNEYQFYGLFEDDEYLVDASGLILYEYGDIEPYAYSHLFAGCTSLKYAPKKKACMIYSHSMDYMFAYCSSLEYMYEFELGACDGGEGGFAFMFIGCTSLKETPKIYIPYMTSVGLFESTFAYCTSLERFEMMGDEVYQDPIDLSQEEKVVFNMLDGCSSLKYVKVNFTNIDYSLRPTENWMRGVPSTGTFVTPSDTNWVTGSNGIPAGWTREDLEI